MVRRSQDKYNQDPLIDLAKHPEMSVPGVGFAVERREARQLGKIRIII